MRSLPDTKYRQCLLPHTLYGFTPTSQATILAWYPYGTQQMPTCSCVNLCFTTIPTLGLSCLFWKQNDHLTYLIGLLWRLNKHMLFIVSNSDPDKQAAIWSLKVGANCMSGLLPGISSSPASRFPIRMVSQTSSIWIMVELSFSYIASRGTDELR